MTPFTLIPKQLICIAMAWLFSLTNTNVQSFPHQSHVLFDAENQILMKVLLALAA